ncbi:MAG TPA: TMEM175 family protein, partial [bacterium]
MKKTSKPTQPSFGGPVLSTKRLEALTDGVFAIVMTLLVFNLKVPLLGPDAP